MNDINSELEYAAILKRVVELDPSFPKFADWLSRYLKRQPNSSLADTGKYRFLAVPPDLRKAVLRQIQGSDCTVFGARYMDYLVLAIRK